MLDKENSYTLTCVTCFAGAVAAAYYVYSNVPVAANPWASAVWLVLFATLADFLAVSLSKGQRVSITPTSLVHWVSTCLLGPFASVVVSTAAAVIGHAATWASYYGARALKRADEARLEAGEQRAGQPASRRAAARQSLVQWLERVGANCYLGDARSIIEVIVLHTGTLALSAALSGLAYYWLGGQFLIDTGPNTDWLPNFVIPFLGLAAVAIMVEYGEYAVVMAVVDPIPGVHGIYGFILRVRLAVVEVALPLWRGELFLVAVALMLAYLYAHIGVWGFVMAVMPVLALRDFFHQWVETKSAYLDTITTLATYVQHYHPYTRGHLKRVADMSERLARELRLPAESIMHMRSAGFLHDIGKVGVSEQILDKTGKLTDDEWDRIKEHPVKGAEIISHLEFLEGIVDWVRYHHRWHNGRGYPASDGDGAEIPVEAAIIAVADAFDAMTDDRELALQWICDSCGHQPGDGMRPETCPNCGAPKRRTFREPKTMDEAIDELRRGAGTQFHPDVVRAFLAMVARDGVHLDA